MNKLTANQDFQYKSLYENLKHTYEELVNRYEILELLCKREENYRQKYSKTQKGKEAQRRASKKYYETHKKTGRPRGRPRKSLINHKKSLI